MIFFLAETNCTAQLNDVVSLLKVKALPLSPVHRSSTPPQIDRPLRRFHHLLVGSKSGQLLLCPSKLLSSLSILASSD
uniref:Uncharacterized protein n=1 Tax=Kalanchoe fedtschenkoi TaxID=63787 RepID=A0A7N1A628_KALFE